MNYPPNQQPPYQQPQFPNYPPPQQPYYQPPMPPRKNEWYKSSGGIIAMLILFFPVGLYLMWRYAAWPKSAKWIVTGVLAVLVVISAATNGQADKSTNLAMCFWTSAQRIPGLSPFRN